MCNFWNNLENTVKPQMTLKNHRTVFLLLRYPQCDHLDVSLYLFTIAMKHSIPKTLWLKTTIYLAC